MASLLRSNIQDFVQEVPLGQMAQGTPFRCLPWPHFKGGRRGKGGGETSQVSNAPPKGRRIHVYMCICMYVFIYIYVCIVM